MVSILGIPNFPHTPHITPAQLIAAQARQAAVEAGQWEPPPERHIIDAGLGDTKRPTAIVAATCHRGGAIDVRGTYVSRPGTPYTDTAAAIVRLLAQLPDDGVQADVRVCASCAGRSVADRVARDVRTARTRWGPVLTYTWNTPGRPEGVRVVHRKEAAGTVVWVSEKQLLHIPLQLKHASRLRASLGSFTAGCHLNDAGEDRYGDTADLEMEGLILGVCSIAYAVRYLATA
ncbi:hypothetical protein I5Q34_00465 [Streptomyces sp. AV19]|uniref:hypothetical protein n=1 Tax=Streptomyces sp. AV19 TaxID=2793068 RepID=UPI0018FE061F|nr:hypothetical protein [Streptomyces sp. AV19]MBH1932781.1 hypothetical protein [Streptomyces sp. AV19]MDG4531452.1 hypothetical protein [Streptomyces sp. AV19]